MLHILFFNFIAMSTSFMFEKKPLVDVLQEIPGEENIALISDDRRTQQNQRRDLALPLVEDLVNSGTVVTIVEVGACDGDFAQGHDPVQSVLKASNVRAYLLEPNPLVFRTLRQNVKKNFGGTDRVSARQLALSNTSGDLSFFVVSEKYAEDFPNDEHWRKYQLSSFTHQHILKKHPDFLSEEEFDKYVEEIKVPTMTPLDFLVSIKEAPTSIDVLVVDAEGYDDVIVGGFLDISEFKPHVLVYEHKHLGSVEQADMQKRLRALGYNVSVIAHGNTLASLP